MQADVGGQDSSLVPRAFSRRASGSRATTAWLSSAACVAKSRAPGVSQRAFGGGTQLLDGEPVKSSTALANASGFSSGMK